MPRANRYFIAGQVYHLTHRCQDRRFLFKFARDRNAYRLKLREAAEQFEVSLLDYCLTRNHVHLLARADTREGISAFMQMAQGQFAQSYNRRRRRTGAFWEDRYHATMIEPGGHLEKCIVYLALNMVRCAAVEHPREWRWCGYQELMGLRQRFRLLDRQRLLEALGGVRVEDFRRQYEALILERIAKGELKREPGWTEAIAVGSEGYVREMESGIRGRQQLTIESVDGLWTLKEAVAPYGSFSEGKNAMQWCL